VGTNNNKDNQREKTRCEFDVEDKQLFCKTGNSAAGTRSTGGRISHSFSLPHETRGLNCVRLGLVRP
jgi:hypothetical protein